MALLAWVRSQRDRVAAFGLIILGAVALVLGYLGVSRSPYVAEDLAYVISGGLGGLFLLGLGGTMLLSADLQDEWRKLDRIEAALNGETVHAEPTPTPNGQAAGDDKTLLLKAPTS